MSWVKIDDGFAEHPKISLLTDREFRIWVTLLCYCGRQGDPTVDRITARSVKGLTPRLASKLEDIGLLDLAQKTPRIDPTFDSVSLTKTIQNVYEIHDWIHYQPKDKTGAERQARYRARRLEQAEPDRYATVTPTVTEPVTPDRYSDRYENVTPVPDPSRPVTTTAPEPEPEANPDDNIDFDTPNGAGAGSGEFEQLGEHARTILERARHA